MRLLGIVLIVLGIFMIVFNGFNYRTQKKVLDVGPIEVNKEETHTVGWPTYAGGLAIVAGVAVLIVGGRKR